MLNQYGFTERMIAKGAVHFHSVQQEDRKVRFSQ
jgi:hypothetical protein